jgi:phosphoribosyl isomerase A
VTFEVIPAIDVVGGRLAIATPGGPRPTEAFDGDPIAAARAYAGAGARWAHVVDLDLASGRGFLNLGVVEAVSDLGLRVQASGGIVSAADAARALEAGASRVVLGSGALVDEREAEHAVVSLGERALVGIEVEGGSIRPRGHVAGELPLVETLGWLTAVGATGFLVTAADRVGRLAGPDLELVRRVVRSGRPVFAAGGVAGLEDLRAIRRSGASGAVVGRAALEGDLDLVAALAPSTPES